MTRSYKKTPVFGWCSGSSQKRGKVRCNRLFRRISKYLLHIGKDGLHKTREVIDQWDLGYDGKWYNTEATKKQMRK